MRRKERAHLERELELKRVDALAQLDAVRAAARPDPAGTATVEDQASSTLETALDLAVAEITAGILQSIEEAQKRLAQGTYGECCECGRPISPERLRALPFAHLCRPCAAASESLRHAPGPHPHGMQCAACGRTLSISWPVRAALCRCGAQLTMTLPLGDSAHSEKAGRAATRLAGAPRGRSSGSVAAG